MYEKKIFIFSYDYSIPFKVHIFWEGHKILRNLYCSLGLSCVVTVKSTVEILQNFVTFSKYMNFTIESITIRFAVPSYHLKKSKFNLIKLDGNSKTRLIWRESSVVFQLLHTTGWSNRVKLTHGGWEQNSRDLFWLNWNKTTYVQQGGLCQCWHVSNLLWCKMMMPPKLQFFVCFRIVHTLYRIFWHLNLGSFNSYVDQFWPNLDFS